MLVTLALLAQTAPALTVDDVCSGPAVIEITGASPDGRLAVVGSPALGTYAIRAGRRLDTVIDLGGPSLALVPLVDASGSARFTPTLTLEHCDWNIQVVDLDV